MSPSFASTGTYTITVGAGGTAVSTNGTNGNAGSNSAIAGPNISGRPFTSAGGGRGAAARHPDGTQRARGTVLHAARQRADADPVVARRRPRRPAPKRAGPAAGRVAGLRVGAAPRVGAAREGGGKGADPVGGAPSEAAIVLPPFILELHRRRRCKQAVGGGGEGGRGGGEGG